MVLLALAVCVVDVANSTDGWSFSQQLHVAVNTQVVRISLVLAILMICAYFRDSARRLRCENNGLIRSLETYSEQLQKKNCELSRLKELSDELIRLTDRKGALNLVLAMVVEVVGADTASIMLREGDEEALAIVASHGFSEEMAANTRVRFGEGIAGKVAKYGKPLMLNSAELPGVPTGHALRCDATTSSVVVPIELHEQVRGVISVEKRNSCFTAEDMGVVSTLANQTSLVLQKITLLDSLRYQVELLEATVEKLRRTRAELMQSEKLASIGELAAGVAHEISNPLQVILGRTELLLAQETAESKLRDLNAILEHTRRISSLVRNLLSFSRPSSDTELRETNVNAVADKTLDFLETQLATRDIAVVRDLQDGLEPVLANAGQLQQVFTNMILNAYQAMAGQVGGTLAVRSWSEPGMILIEFTDTGPGILQEHLDRLFEPFFTTKPEGEGTGLGLAIVYGIIQSHGGSIQVRNNPDRGACFTVSLPAKQSPPGDEGAKLPVRQHVRKHDERRLDGGDS